MAHFMEERLTAENATSAIETELISRSLAQFVSVSLPPVAAGLGLLYLLFSFSHLLVAAPAIGRPMALTAGISSLLLFVLAWVLRLRVVDSLWAHFWAAIITGICLLNSWLHLILTQDLLQSTNFLLLIVGVGFLFLSTQWLVVFILVTLLSWGSALYWFAIPTDDIVHFAFGLVSACLMAALAHNARKTRLVNLARLHYQDQEKATHLQAALEAVQANEAALRTSEAQYRALSLQLEEQAEALRVANQALASASKMKDEFLASMSHELRTPLTTILGVTESLQEQVYGPVLPRQTQALGNVLESGGHLLDLINDILDVAKTEAGQYELEIVPADAQMIVEASVRFIQKSAETKQITVVVEIDPQVKLLLADDRRLKQILLNLLNNAVKFTEEGGKIGLRLIGDLEQQIVRFTIWDTGIGIQTTQMSRLFKPFIQLDSRLARRYGGSGLGLVLVYRMTEMHGGSVSIVSEPGNGSQFTVTLPWRIPHSPLAPVLSTVPPPTPALATPTFANSQPSLADQYATADEAIPKPPKLLVIDDHKLSLEWLASVAAAAGCTVIATDSVLKVPQLVVENRPDLILLDMQIPNTDTLLLLQTLAKGAQPNPPPVVAISALDLPGAAEEAKAAGASDYLVKPLSALTLRNIVDRILQTVPECV